MRRVMTLPLKRETGLMTGTSVAGEGGSIPLRGYWARPSLQSANVSELRKTGRRIMSSRETIRHRAAQRRADRDARRNNVQPHRPAHEQIGRLDARLGVGVGAVRERAKLAARNLKPGALASKAGA